MVVGRLALAVPVAVTAVAAAAAAELAWSSESGTVPAAVESAPFEALSEVAAAAVAWAAAE